MLKTDWIFKRDGTSIHEVGAWPTSEGFWEVEAVKRSCRWLLNPCFIRSAWKEKRRVSKPENAKTCVKPQTPYLLESKLPDSAEFNHVKKDLRSRREACLSCELWRTCFWTSPPIFWLKERYWAKDPWTISSKASTYTDTAPEEKNKK